VILRRAGVIAAALLVSLAALGGGSAASRNHYPWIVVVASADQAMQPFQLFRVRLSGAGLEQITHGSRNADDPNFSPDGNRLVFTRIGEGVFAVKPDGTGLRRLTGGADDRYPVWSPNGTAIAFLHPYRNESRLYVMRADGRMQRRLRFTPGPASRPSWTPDGRSLLVEADGGVLQVDARTGKVQRRLRLPIELAPSEAVPTFSPNDRSVVYVGRRPEPAGCERTACEVFALYLARLSAAGARRIVDDAGPAGWSPDSRRIVFVHGARLEVRSVLGGLTRSIAIGLNALLGDAPPAITASG
jgi:Tol biopolymer transport system component